MPLNNYRRVRKLLNMHINLMSQDMKFYVYASSIDKIHLYAPKRVNLPLNMEGITPLKVSQ